MITLADIKDLERKNQENLTSRTRLETTIEQLSKDLEKRVVELKEVYGVDISEAEQTIANLEMEKEEAVQKFKEILG